MKPYNYQPTGEHFNRPGHNIYHLKVNVLEMVWDLGRNLLEVREPNTSETMTEFTGMNRQKKQFLFNCKL